MELFGEVVNGKQPKVVNLFRERSILDGWRDSDVLPSQKLKFFKI